MDDRPEKTPPAQKVEAWPSDWLRATLGLAALRALEDGPSYGYAIIFRPGGERGLGAELHDRRRIRSPTVFLDVVLDEAVCLGVDVPGASGELRHQLLRHRGVAVAAHVAGLPLDPAHPGQVIGENRLVQLGERDCRGVYRPPVERAPSAVEYRLDLVADDDVRVQMRSPARESKWSNAVAISPVTSTCATAPSRPVAPVRVAATSRSMNATTSATAA